MTAAVQPDARHSEADATSTAGSSAPGFAVAPEPDVCALGFLGSEFSGHSYIDWPIERRLEAYLRHMGLADLADDGEGFGALLERVMVNFATARRAGWLAH